MYYDDLKHILERSLFREIQAREKENIELNRKVYEVLLPNFPSFKLVKLEKENDSKISCLGYFENRTGKHLIKFSGLIENGRLNININAIQSALREEGEKEESKVVPQINELVNQNKEKISQITSLINFLLDRKKTDKYIEEVLGGYDLESIYLKNILSIKGIKVSFPEIVKLVRDTYLNFDYLLNFDRMIELLSSLKEKVLSEKQEDFYFKREIPYNLETYEGTSKGVKAHVFYKDLNSVDDIVDLYFTDMHDNLIENEFEYSTNRAIREEIFEKLKKEASSGISVPLGYQTTTIRINKAFLPDNLEIGDVIVLDGITYKLISKDENKLSDIGEGSYYVFTPVIEVGGFDDK